MANEIKEQDVSTDIPKGYSDAQAFIWEASYIDGSQLKEFDSNGVENNFYDIDATQLTKFVLKALTNEFGFDATTGELICNGQRITISLGDTAITRPSVEIIQYKDAEALFSPGGGQVGGTVIKAFNIGYKWLEGDLSAKLITTVSNGIDNKGKPVVFITLRVVSDRYFSGPLTLSDNVGSESSVDIELKPGIATELRIGILAE